MGLPFTLCLWGAWLIYEQNGVPNLNLIALFYCILGSFFQVIFTIALITSFNYKNFATSVAFSKTDVLLAALIEITILSIAISNQVILGIVIGSISVFFLSFTQRSKDTFDTFISLRKKFISIGTLIGLSAGLAITLAQIFFRLSIISIDGSLINKALFISSISLTFQTLIFGFWLYLFRKRNLISIFKNLKSCIPVGLSATGATIFWFIGFGLATVAEVKAIGQLELIFSVLISIFIFKEKIKITEYYGILLLSSSILIVIFGKI